MANIAKINLVNLKHNALKIKKSLKKGVKFCAVVKANAYGHGGAECANALYKIVDCFAVALLEEGVNLRLSGIDKDILVLIPLQKKDVPRAVEYDLTLTVCSINDAKIINDESVSRGKKTKVHIAYNTGMNRLGINDITELSNLLSYLSKAKGVVLDGFFSHFAKPENKKALSCALDKFLLAKKLIKRYNNKVTCHISASGGFLMGVQEDMVRIGLLLYGYKPFPHDVKLKPVMKVYSHVVSNHHLKAGDAALYGLRKTEIDRDIAIIRYGYADGLMRKEISGQFNNRCMDLTAIKSTKKRGAVCVLDNADALAKEYKTISYEILCSAGGRAKKIYVR